MRFIKLNYYVVNAFLDLIPREFFSKKKMYTILNTEERINYYNKLDTSFLLEESISIGDFKRPRKLKTYYFDLIETLRFFCKTKKLQYKFGDIIEVPVEPSFVKSRPIHSNNSNSIILKLNKVRHFKFIKDKKRFVDKKDILIGRGRVFNSQPHRVDFLNKYYNHPLCNLGTIKSDEMPAEWDVPKLSVKGHLKYKFILSLEGNDVATNLKWIMSSNSIAVMPMPKYETWFMEGTLLPDHHFICLKDDYSDLEKKLNYYIKHTDKALEIVKNANDYVRQFKNKKLEEAIAFGVVKKYFDLQEEH